MGNLGFSSDKCIHYASGLRSRRPSTICSRIYCCLIHRRTPSDYWLLGSTKTEHQDWMLRGWLQRRPWGKHQETSADEKMLAIHQSRLRPKIKKMKLNKIDLDSKQYMKRAEKKCRRIKSGRIPSSPEASIWIQRAQVYRSLLRYHSGNIRNKGNLKRSARRCKIVQPLLLSIGEVKAKLLSARKLQSLSKAR